ncbi:MAG TPA: hypothetical protein VN381_16410, partial [Anaerovoracaceae bacterium]|nr:hypothetical protein [Anaerovoracaceae bacterium]
LSFILKLYHFAAIPSRKLQSISLETCIYQRTLYSFSKNALTFSFNHHFTHHFTHIMVQCGKGEEDQWKSGI